MQPLALRGLLKPQQDGPAGPLIFKLFAIAFSAGSDIVLSSGTQTNKQKGNQMELCEAWEDIPETVYRRLSEIYSGLLPEEIEWVGYIPHQRFFAGAVEVLGDGSDFIFEIRSVSGVGIKAHCWKVEIADGKAILTPESL